MRYHYLSDDFNTPELASECELGNPELHAGTTSFQLTEAEPSLREDGWGMYTLAGP